MTKHNLLWPGAALAGATAWLAKLVVILAVDDDAAAVAVLYILGVSLLVLGAIGLGVHLTRGRAWWQRVLAGAAGVLALFASFAVLDSLASAVLGDVGPSYFQPEWGILATALAWLAAAVVGVRRTPA